MTQLSAPVARTVAVLNFLAGHPEQAFTLSEIAKSLRMSSATCHNLLAALVKANYVYRTVGKTYVLGPALARVAQASIGPAIVMQVVRPEMRLLADEFDVVCSVSHIDGEDVVVRERASAVSHINWNRDYYLRTRLAAPLGGVFTAWLDERGRQEWLGRADPPLDDEESARLLGSLAFAREHGFTFGIRKVALGNPDHARELAGQEAFTDYAVPDLEPGRKYELAYVTAPIFARPGEVALVLGLAGFVEPVSGKAIGIIGERLRAACDRIGAFIAGRDPLLARRPRGGPDE